MLPPALDLIRGKRGEEVGPRISLCSRCRGRRGRGSPLAVSLKKIGSWLAMLSIRLYQRFLISVISPDYDTVVTKSFFCLDA